MLIIRQKEKNVIHIDKTFKRWCITVSSKIQEHYWYDYPQKILYWRNDIDYAMFIDENGNSSKINSIFKKIMNNKNIDENDRYFTITGCVFTKENYQRAKKDIEKLKNR